MTDESTRLAPSLLWLQSFGLPKLRIAYLLAARADPFLLFPYPREYAIGALVVLCLSGLLDAYMATIGMMRGWGIK